MRVVPAAAHDLGENTKPMQKQHKMRDVHATPSNAHHAIKRTPRHQTHATPSREDHAIKRTPRHHAKTTPSHKHHAIKRTPRHHAKTTPSHKNHVENIATRSNIWCIHDKMFATCIRRMY
jgi:hypothetical protein